MECEEIKLSNESLKRAKLIQFKLKRLLLLFKLESKKFFFNIKITTLLVYFKMLTENKPFLLKKFLILFPSNFIFPAILIHLSQSLFFSISHIFKIYSNKIFLFAPQTSRPL